MAIASWLTPAAKSGTGNKTVGLTASKNIGASRTTIVTVSVSGITKTINCIQTEADKFTIKISSSTTNSSGTTITNVGDCSIGSSATGGVKEGTYYRDTSVTLTAKAAPTGYDFVGWYEGSNLVSTSLSFAVTLTANRTLVAKYKIKSYTVNATSEDTNKGTVSPAGQTVEHGANATVVATSKAAYNFAGWYNGATKVSSNASYTFAVTANISLTAKFTIKTFTTTTANSTGGTASVNKSSVEYGGSAIWTATPSTGYNFSKWSNGSTANPLTVSNITANTHITPVFVLKSYTVIWNPNGGSVSPTSTTKTHGSTLGTLPTPTRAADVQYTYTFKGWFTAATGGTQVSASTTVTKNVTYYAQWTATLRSYTATFNGNGGGTPSPSTITKTYGSELGTLPTCSRTGYTFLGWYTASSGGTKISSTTKITGTVTYYAQWSINSYTLTYNVNGGNAVSPASKSVQYGSAYGTLPTPTKSSDAEYTYAFAGWYTAASGGTQVTTNTTMGAGNTTIYAHWTATRRSYTATFNGNGGGTPSPSTITKTYGSELGTLPTCSRTGYTFLGWYTASSGGTKISSTTKITGTVTYYAQWSINSYTLTYNVNGGNAVSPASKSVQYGSAYGTLPTPTKSSDAEYTYAFAGWYTAASGGTQVTTNTTMGAGNTTIYAHWTATRRSYTIGYQTTYGSLNRTSQSVAYGSKGSCTLTMPSNNAQYTYTFQGWYTAANGGGTKVGSSLTLETPSVTGAATYYAYVTRAVNRYTFTFNANGGSTPSSSSITKNYNEAIGTLPTCSRAADNTYTYTFAGWFDTSATSGGTQLTTTTKVTSNKTWYARWTATYKNYTVTWNGNGGTPSKSSSSFHYNDALGTLPTATRTGYTFKGWSTSASGSVNVSTTTKVTGNVTYYAVWQINSYTLTVTAGTGGTVSGGGTYNYGATATLKATPSAGYHFVKWSDGNTNASRTVTVTGNATYTATFKQDPYLNLDKTSLTFEAAGGTQTVKVTSNVNWTVS
jgi:uncharacterized repeat protein (TIGR02543 family)